MDPARYRTVAGVAFVGGGAVSVLGIVTAESQYPGYSTGQQTISALGGAGGTPGSQLAFNTTMAVAGLLLVLAAYSLQRSWGRRSLTAVLAVTAVGFVGVGVFPSETGLPHVVAAVLTFVGIGLAALVVATTVRGPFRAVSAALGTLELLAFVAFVALEGATTLGEGGLERWVAYLGLVWAVAFGGFLLGVDGTDVER